MLVSSDSLVALGNKTGCLLLLAFEFERAKGSFRRFVGSMEAGSLLVLELFVYSHVSSPQLAPSDVALACVWWVISARPARTMPSCHIMFLSVIGFRLSS